MPCATDDPVGCTTACEGGFAEDCVTLGVMYLGGATVTVDRERAVSLFRKACGADSARGCLLLGDAFHAGMVPTPAGGAGGRDPHEEEVLFYRRACDGGANQGCVRAGRALAEGHGTTLDPAHAAALFAPVCDRGNAEGCLELGKLFASGSGVKKNADRALALFTKACGLGLQEGCLRASPKGETRSPRSY
jgi:TPR repeat protein